ncbi:hypothetical protein G4Y73_05815 [Wenzhouxiangella sp. XN201]|uniref:hypothetical protein n=1 Tax=Wenzhouxiangella sp. XN201 TaxID=2710755 RepID=UPI0013C773DF|nr:hypothetical protein [Wenzhouxiangella sp. XN201]NEZ03670.1 hypothetical protein [Wenzhouxiangella sp. XN201]
MFIDALILLPVTLFLLWLYAYSGPSELRGRAWWVDRLPALLALVVSLGVLAWLHITLDVDGLYRNIVAVVSAYLVLLAGLGLAWLMRWRRDRR